MKKVLIVLGIIVAVVGLCIGIAFGTGWAHVGYTQTVGKAQQNADTTVYHHTQAYIDGAAKDIAKVKLEYEQSTDAAGKKALVEYIQTSYANVDPSQINNPSVAAWLRAVQNNTLN